MTMTSITRMTAMRKEVESIPSHAFIVSFPFQSYCFAYNLNAQSGSGEIASQGLYNTIGSYRQIIIT
jgi:hypothetical protein